MFLYNDNAFLDKREHVTHTCENVTHKGEIVTHNCEVATHKCEVVTHKNNDIPFSDISLHIS